MTVAKPKNPQTSEGEKDMMRLHQGVLSYSRSFRLKALLDKHAERRVPTYEFPVWAQLVLPFPVKQRLFRFRYLKLECRS